MLIDICKLRPGDLIFSRSPAWVSRSIALATASRYSHAAIVVYPDVWFETDGAGSGFKRIDNVNCFDVSNGKYAVVADMAYVKLDVLRVSLAPSPENILLSIRNHMALKYPSWIEFIPLLLPMRPFTKFSDKLVSYLSGESESVGGYCSQMVSEVLRSLYGITVGGHNDHVSPGTLRRRLLEANATRIVSALPLIPTNWAPSAQLQNIYRNLLKVTAKLQAYQYPQDIASFHQALSDTFKEEGIKDDPRNYAISTTLLRQILTNPQFFRMHEIIWPSKYT